MFSETNIKNKANASVSLDDLADLEPGRVAERDDCDGEDHL